MELNSTDRRRRPRTKQPHQRFKICLDEGSRPFEAKVVDAGAGGMGIEAPVKLAVGSMVSLDGEIIEDGERRRIQGRGHVLWCRPAPGGVYRAGLSFENGSLGESFPQSWSARTDSGLPFADHYDVMELGPKASPDTIHRVYRILAQRYHPDNAETGDEQQFKRLVEAYRVLSDPEQRAGYDAGWRKHQHQTWKIFDHSHATRGAAAERRKRQGILSLLYTKRAAQPEQPALTIHELEDLLGCPREHLEFSLWYLKESALISRSDNGRHTITAKGVEQAEAELAPAGLEHIPLLEPPEQAQKAEQHHRGS